MHKYLQPGAIFIPLAKSCSSDMMYPIPTSHRLDAQWKQGVQQIKESTIASEGKKTALGKRSDEYLTLLIAGFNVDQNLLELKGAKIVDDNGTQLSVHFPAGSSFTYSSKFQKKMAPLVSTGLYNKKNNFVVPDGMDIVILLPAGMDLLLTTQNAALLRDEQEVGSFTAHLRSTVMKRASSMRLNSGK